MSIGGLYQRSIYVIPILLFSLMLFGCSSSGTLSVTQFDPEGETERSTNFTITFSKPVVNESSLNRMLDSTAVKIEPKLSVRSRWIAPNVLQILPAQPLAPATQYTITVLPEIVQDPAQRLTGKRDFNLRTPRLVVQNGVPLVRPDPSNPELVVINIDFNFNEEVDDEMLKSNLGLAWTKGEFKGKIEYEISRMGAKRFRLISQPQPRGANEDNQLQMTINKRLTPRGGTLPMNEDYTLDVLVNRMRRLTVRQVSPGQEGRQLVINISMSSAINIETAKEYIKLTPEQEFQVTQRQRGQLSLTGSFTSGDHIVVELRPGLQALDGSRLKETYSQNIGIPDYRPFLQYSAPGSYLSRKGLQNVELTTMNKTKVQVEVEKIYQNNLVAFLHQQNTISYSHIPVGMRIFEEELDIESNRNIETRVTIGFSDFLKDHPAGLFRLMVRDRSTYWQSDQRIVMLTDIGLIAKRAGGELTIWAISIETLRPLEGVQIELLSTTNQRMQSGVSNAEGRVHFSNIGDKWREFSPFVLTARNGNDYSYLLFRDCELSTSDFDVNGRPTLNQGYEAFLYGDRGVYRPGETAHMVAIVRQPKLAIPQDVPLRLDVIAPDGAMLTQIRGRSDHQGMAEFTIKIPAYARTGRYDARLLVVDKNQIGSKSFSVEEFMPDRIKVEIATDKTTYALAEEVKVDMSARLMFGPPAAGRKYELRYWFEPGQFVSSRYPGYTFVNPEGKLTEIDRLLGSGTLDNKGKVSITYVVPEDLRSPSTIQAVFEATVEESGGRAITGRHRVTVNPYPFYLGIQRVKDGYAVPGKTETFKWVALNHNGDLLSVDGVVARLSQVRWNTILESDANGRARYQSQRHLEVVEVVELGAGKDGEFSFDIKQNGQYQVTVSKEGSESKTGLTFFASGWGYSPWSMEHPERVILELDRADYETGDMAEVLVQAPMSGRLLLTVERDKVLYSKLIRMDQNTAKIEVPILASFDASAYVTATLVRSPDESDVHSPMRAYGVVPLNIEMKNKKLPLTIQSPQKAAPNEPFEVRIQVPNASTTAEVTVAVVDEGILQLTSFETPAAHGFFYGKRLLEVRTFDIFGLLLPEAMQADIHTSTGGDRDMRRRSHINPLSASRVKPVALWSGILPVRNGEAVARFDIPDYNGQLRVMAHAVSGSSFGSADRDVIVRSPIVLMPYLPRFISGGDKFEAPVSVSNLSGGEADVTVVLSLNGPLQMDSDEPSRTIHLANGEEGELLFKLSALESNQLATVTFTATAGGIRTVSRTDLPVRPPVAPISLSGFGSVIADKSATIRIPNDLLPGTAYYHLVLTPTPEIRFSHSLQWLLRYPYGCLEQTTSQAFPLLYYHKLASLAEPDHFKDSAPEYYVEEAISRIISMQQSAGFFRFWQSGGRANPWANIYAFHFLEEARRHEYAVPERVLNEGKRYLRDLVNVAWDDQKLRRFGKADVNSEYYWLQWTDYHKLRIQTYALYVLARLGEPDKGAMYRLNEKKGEELTPETKLMLAAAYHEAGDAAMVKKLLPGGFPAREAGGYHTGRTFYSHVQGEALSLYLLAQIAPDHFLIPQLTKRLNERFDKAQLRTTQETAWAMLAFGQLLESAGEVNYHGRLNVDNKTVATFGSEDYRHADSTFGGKNLELSIEGSGRCFYFWEARGMPRKHEYRDIEKGISVSRRYITADGGSISMKDVKQGDLVVAQIYVEADAFLQNVVIDDLLPAGLEIENPRLDSRQRLGNVAQSTMALDAMDIRDDRLLIYTNLAPNREVTYTYLLRAVTAGTFVLPPITAECMYDPDIRGSSSSGFVTVKR